MRRLVLLALSAVLPGCVATAVLSADAEARFPDVGSHVVVEGLRLRYAESGAGRPIVLLHGAYGGLEDWEATIFGDVALRGRAIAFDRPGHGWSDRPCEPATPEVQARVLREACRAIGADRPVLVGFSWGGSVAAAWAAAWPDDVAGIVLMNAPTHAWGGAPDTVDVIAGIPFLGGVLTTNFLSPIGSIVGRSRAGNAFAPESVPPAFDRSPLALALRPASFLANAEGFRILDAALAAQSVRYGDIRCPVVFVVGEEDRIVGPRFHAPRFAAQVPQTRCFVVAGAGHQLPYAHPDDCLRALDAILSEEGRGSARLPEGLR